MGSPSIEKRTGPKSRGLLYGHGNVQFDELFKDNGLCTHLVPLIPADVVFEPPLLTCSAHRTKVQL